MRPTNGGVRGGKPTLGSNTLLTEYARGNDGDIFNDGTAKLLQAGSKLRFSFHYHPNGERAVNEHAKIGFKFFPKGYTPKHLISTKGISSPTTLGYSRQVKRTRGAMRTFVSMNQQGS